MHDDLNSYFGEGITMRGVLKFKGTLRFDGNFEGEVQTPDTFIIGNTGKIKAKVGAGSLFNMGEIIGDVKAKKKISIFPDSNLVGNIDTPAFIAEEGAVFKGSCTMPSTPAPKVARGEDAKLKRALSKSGSGFFQPSAGGSDASWREGAAESGGRVRGKGFMAAVAVLLAVLGSGGYFVFISMNELGKSGLERRIFEMSVGDDKNKTIMLADTYFKEKNFTKAASLYLSLKEKFSDDSSFLRKLAVSIESNGDIDGAITYFEQLFRADPSDKEVIAKLVAHYAEEKDFGKTIRLKETIVGNDPDDMEAVNSLYALYSQTNQLENALELYTEKIAASPATAENFMVIGRLERQLDRMDGAIDSFSKAVLSSPADIAPHLELAYAYHKTGRESQAVRAFREVVKLDRNHVEAINSFGFASLTKNRIEKSIELFNMALTKEPGNLRSYLGLATVYSRLGDREKAELYCRKILEKDANYAPALNRLAWTLARAKRNLAEAEQYSIASMKYNADAPEYLDTLSEVYYQKKEYQKAVDQITHALKLSPRNKYFQAQLAKFKAAKKRAG